MIRCNSPKGDGKCVAEMDGQQSKGSTIVCDIAEDLEFCADDILAVCEFAVGDEQNQDFRKENRRTQWLYIRLI